MSNPKTFNSENDDTVIGNRPIKGRESSGDERSEAVTVLSERQKMEQGLPYLADGIPGLMDARQRTRPLLQKFNNYPWPLPPAPYWGPDEKQAILGELLGVSLDVVKEMPIDIEPPFHVNFGKNITFEGAFFANTGLVILDDLPVKLGARVLCGPRVGIYTASHSTDVEERRADYETAYPIEIGDDCWIGGGAIINGPCCIGKGCTVAAGAVVRGSFPDHCVIGGVPARILKHLELTK